jgi:hypothetical protein
MNIIRIAAALLIMFAFLGICSAIGSPKAKRDNKRLEIVCDLLKETDEKRLAFWEKFEIYGRFALASEVAAAFDLPDDAIPLDKDSVMLVGYYVIPEKPPFGFFEFRFDLVVDGVEFDLGDASFSGLTFSPKRLPFCKLVRPASGFGRPVPVSKLKILLDQTPKLILRGSMTK